MYSIEKIAEMCGGQLVHVSSTEAKVQHLLTDSRRFFSNTSTLFIPLVTSTRNAHRFIPELYAKGVKSFIVAEDIPFSKYEDANFIRVPDTLKALQRLAQSHRHEFTYPVVGITGSNGKTIVKEWLFHILHEHFHITRSPKSYNSQIGVPLSVWQMDTRSDLAIFEAGISEKNEMSNLETIIRPDIGILTNIGDAHSEGFLSKEEKLNEKLKLFLHSDMLIYHADEPWIEKTVQAFKKDQNRHCRLFSWGQKDNADLRVSFRENKNQGTLLTLEYKGETYSVEIPFKDDAYRENALICLAFLFSIKESHLTEDVFLSCLKKVSELKPMAMRLELLKGIENCTILNDSYSSDLSSLRIALEFLSAQQQHRKRTVILSDLKDQGDPFIQLKNMLLEFDIQRLIGIGEDFYKNRSFFQSEKKWSGSFYKSTDSFLSEFDFTSLHNEGILVKGARAFAFEKIVHRLEAKLHETVLQINLDAFIQNLNQYKKKLHPNTRVMAMVKAFSYGSGTFEIANALQHDGVDYLAVAYPDEGVHLRQHGIQMPILVLNSNEDEADAMIRFRLEPEIFSLQQLKAMWEQIRNKVHTFSIHIKLDTGMNRLGFKEKDLDELVHFLQANPGIKVLSIFSHLVGSEDVDMDVFTEKQKEMFDRMWQKLEKELNIQVLKHLSNSSGAVRHPELNYDMVRIGLGLYGIDSSGEIQNDLKPIATLRAGISQIHEVEANETIGYNRMGKVNRKSKIATVNIGYADGYRRKLGNGRAKVKVKNQLVPTIGNVCMDMIMIDVTDVEGVKPGDEVILFGEDPTVMDLAKWCDTIPYEIITGISQRVKRIYFQE